MITRSFLKPPLIVLGILFISCNKNDRPTGLGIQPENDLLTAIYCDTATVIGFTVKEDSIRTDELSFLNYHVLGSVMDPVFGRSDASLYANFTTGTNHFTIGNSPKLDSIVLAIQYCDGNKPGYGPYYGNINSSLKYNIYKLTQDLSSGNFYSSQRRIPYDSINDITYSGRGIIQPPNLYTTRNVMDEILNPQLRIRLKNELGQDLLDDTSRIQNPEALKTYFKGLFITTRNSITPSPIYGNIVNLDGAASQSNITIYYHNGSEDNIKAIDLPMETYFNFFEHDYGVACDSLKIQLNHSKMADTLKSRRNLFLQGIAGTKAKISFPYLHHLADAGAIAINKAELIVKVDQEVCFNNPGMFPAPASLMLEGLNQNNGVEPLEESTDSYAFSGIYNSATGEYKFEIPATIQQIVSGKYPNYRFYLSVFQQRFFPAPVRQLNPSRIVIGAGNKSIYPIRLKLWYTKRYKNN
ncbi:MAG TPA: DUF4270 family protein [Nitrosopumilaceae archaeon]|nr:DUF4270 family protein [Nitrosopumilaceae archaeon]